MFAYCYNSPVGTIDQYGTVPGDIFETPEDAAEDFAIYINGKSIRENREYASYIYSVTYFKYETVSIDSFLRRVFPSLMWRKPLGADKTICIKIPCTMYTYKEPEKGTKDSSSPPINYLGRDTVVGRLHTHAAYDPAYINDDFSQADITNAIKDGVPTFVATPLGIMRKYDPATGVNEIIFQGLPFDPNHPDAPIILEKR